MTKRGNIPVLMAGSFISAVPAIIVYLIFQRYLVRGHGAYLDGVRHEGRIAGRCSRT